jgi:hypothetical protein
VQNQTWNTPYQISDTLHIRFGATLTIKSSLYCADNALIYIHENGELIVDGGTITSLCHNAAWPGILVEGNPHWLSIYQGKLTLKNNATIANAKCGVTLNHESVFYGGRISASTAHFVNNATAVSFVSPPPEYVSPIVRCSFGLCTFEVNNNYMASLPAFQAHINLRSAQGIIFTACQFKNMRTAGTGMGINAVNSGFRVEGRCNNSTSYLDGICDESDLTRSLFQGFNKAVSITGTSTIMNATIDQAAFVNNITGVYVNAANNVSVLRSNFNWDNAGTVGNKKGVYILNSTGFRVEENSFTGSLLNATGLYGVVVENSGGNNNEIYKNNFDKLTIGQQFIGINRSGLEDIAGLKSLCNIHTDIAVKDVDVISGLFNDGTINSSYGIAYHQKGNSNGQAAGNSFSDNATLNYSNIANPIYYFYHASTLNGLPTVSGHSIIILDALNGHDCPSKITGLQVSEEIDYYDNYNTNKSAHQTIQYNYNQLIDGGNTEALMHAVQGEWSDDVWKIRQELLMKSPYLSQDVLIEVAKENLLPQALYLEVCLANPDATKDYSFLKFLQYEIPNPLPAYMISLIESSWSQKTLRTDMESALSSAGSEKDYWLNLLIAEAQQDSIQNRPLIRSLYLDRGSYSDHFSVAEGYIEENSFNAAFETMYDLMQTLPKITAEQEAEIAAFEAYIAYRNALYSAEKSIYALDSADIDQLIYFVETHKGRGRVLAHNILCELYEICFEDIPERSLVQQQGQGGNESLPSGDPSAGTIQVFPNPAKEYTSFIWGFGSFDGVALLTITDRSGKQIHVRQLSGAQGQWVWDTRTVSNGVYLYEVTANGVQLGSGKIVITK